MDLKEMDVVVFESKTFFGKLISKITNSKYSHVAIVIDAKSKLIVEAKATVRITQLDSRKHIILRYYEPFSDIQIGSAKAYLSAMLGKVYDAANILDTFINFFRTAFNKPYRKYWGKDDLPVCTELVANAYTAAGVPLFSKPNWAVIPPDFVNSNFFKEVK